MLDFATCTECGRCQSQCPAWNTEKPLSPKMLILNLRDHAFAKAPYLLADEERARLAAAGRARRGGAAAGRRDRGPGVGADRRRGHRHRRAVVVRDVRRLRRAVPGRHRARRPHHRHAPLPGAGRVELPRRAQPAVQGHGEQGQPVEHVAHRAHGLGQGPAFDVKVVGEDVESLDEVEWLFWVGCAGAYEDRAEEDDPGGRRAAAHGRRVVRRARQRRDLHRRPGAPGRQRVRLPGARRAERRDLQGAQGQEGRRDLRALLQHAEERVRRSSASSSRSSTTPSCSTGWCARAS